MSITRRVMVLLAALSILAGLAVPAGADPQGYVESEIGVGYFYGTFGESPNMMLLAGGTAEEFCIANPGDPFNGEPGLAPLRLFFRSDGSVDLKVNDKFQPIYVYETATDNGPLWIEQLCADFFSTGATPEIFASGSADLKVRISVVSDDLVEVFNSVNGKVAGTDGREWKVRAWADLTVENGMPVGSPADFVGFKMTEIRP